MNNTPSPSISFTAGILLLCLAIVWGGSFFFAEIALREVPPLSITLHRIFWAIPVLLVVLRWKGITIPTSGKAWACYLVMGALNNAIPFSLIFWGQSHIDSGLASILNGTTAVFGAVVAGILLVDEPLSLRKIIGALVGLFGVAIIMGLEAFTQFILHNMGQVAILGAALSYSFAAVWGKRFLKNYPPVMNACGMLLGATVLMLPVTFYVEGIPSFSLSLEVWASLISVAFFSTAIAYLLYFEILIRAGSANLMLVTLLIPPIAVGLGYGFLGEQLSQEAAYGFIVIGLGLVITDGRLLSLIRRKAS